MEYKKEDYKYLYYYKHNEELWISVEENDARDVVSSYNVSILRNPTQYENDLFFMIYPDLLERREEIRALIKKWDDYDACLGDGGYWVSMEEIF